MITAKDAKAKANKALNDYEEITITKIEHMIIDACGHGNFYIEHKVATGSLVKITSFFEKHGYLVTSYPSYGSFQIRVGWE